MASPPQIEELQRFSCNHCNITSIYTSRTPRQFVCEHQIQAHCCKTCKFISFTSEREFICLHWPWAFDATDNNIIPGSYFPENYYHYRCPTCRLITVTTEKNYQCQHIIDETSSSDSESSTDTTDSFDNDISDNLNNGMCEDHTDMTQVLAVSTSDTRNKSTRSVKTQTEPVLILAID